MRLLHELAKIHATFDDPRLVSQAGLGDLAGEYVRISRPCGVHARVKIGCLVAGMIAGADTHRGHGPAAPRGAAGPVRRDPGAVHAGVVPAVVYLGERAAVGAGPPRGAGGAGPSRPAAVWRGHARVRAQRGLRPARRLQIPQERRYRAHETWALLALYQALRIAITDAAGTLPGTDPDRASYQVAVQTAQALVTSARNVVTTTGLAGDIGRAVLATLHGPRRPRVCARRVKSPLSRWNKHPPGKPRTSPRISKITSMVPREHPPPATRQRRSLTPAPGP